MTTESITQLLSGKVQVIKELRKTLPTDQVSDLSFEGVCLLDVFSVENARIYFPQAENKATRRILGAKACLVGLINVFAIVRSLFSRDPLKVVSADVDVLVPTYSAHIWRDVLHPVCAEMVGSREMGVAVVGKHVKGSLKLDKDIIAADQSACVSLSQSFALIGRATRIFVRWFEIKKYLDDDGFFRRYPFALKGLARLHFAETFRLLWYIQSARNILEKCNPSTVLVGDVADPRTRIFLYLCKAARIPTLSVQFGMVTPNSIEWQFFEFGTVAVWGNKFKRELVAHGVPWSQILVTGSPRNDSLFKTPVRDVLRKAGDRSLIILVASTFHTSEYSEVSKPETLNIMKRALSEVSLRQPDIKLLIKPHPSESADSLVCYGSASHITFIDQLADIRPLIASSDLFVSFGSTATADALLQGVPVVCPVFDDWCWSEEYVATGAVLVAESVDELDELFFRAGQKEGYETLVSSVAIPRENLIKDWFFKHDGCAASRLVDVIQLGIRHECI